MKRWRSKVFPAFLVAVLSVFLFLPAGHAGTASSLLSSYVQGGKILSDTPTYDWWYGCSPTSAGMMVGYYDRNGYAGLSYGNLVKGGVAESTTVPSTAGIWNYNAQYAIASPGHVSAYYHDGYNKSGDDYKGTSRTVADYDSLADFMGTSQDALSILADDNVNGGTNFWYDPLGAKVTAEVLYSAGYDYYNSDGMYGIWEYLHNYCGYDVPLSNVFTQAIYSSSAPLGFTFEDYIKEIDAGRVVMIQVEGHSMFGYGYDDAKQLIYFYNTWDDDAHVMDWGGSYEGMAQWGVVCFTLDGGSAVPLPPSILLLAFGLAGIGGFRFRSLCRK